MPTDPQSITEADVLAFFKAKCAEIQPQFSELRDLTIRTFADNTKFMVSGYKADHSAGVGTGSTINEAAAMARASIGEPEVIAAGLRAKAQKLLDEADAIAPVADVAEIKA